MSVAVALAFTLGCGHGALPTDKAVAEMRDTIQRMQADRDRLDDRLEALEIAVADLRAPRAQAGEGSRGEGPHARAAVSIHDDGRPEGDREDADDITVRPEIRVVGGHSSARPARGKSEPAIVIRESAGGYEGDDRPAALDPDAKKAYDAALELVRAKRYDAALEALTSFLVRWPGHPYAENAMYWRGEVYYARSEFAAAAREFEGVVARYATGAKVPDALLKLGMSSERLGNPEGARQAWNRLRSEFPKSPAANMIPQAASKGPKEIR